MENIEKNFIIINTLKYPKILKCSCCNRVRDIYFKIVILDADCKDLQVGDLDFCQTCGNNLNKILGSELEAGERILKEFTFN